MLEEYLAVIGRPKFSKFVDFKSNADFLIARISEISEVFDPKQKLTIIQDDADNRVLELAEISKADFIITGNITDFTMKTFGETKVLTPKEYWENYKKY